MRVVCHSSDPQNWFNLFDSINRGSTSFYTPTILSNIVSSDNEHDHSIEMRMQILLEPLSN